jgi:hypothetical protein
VYLKRRIAELKKWNVYYFYYYYHHVHLIL